MKPLKERFACDEYCPQESCVQCGLPEYSEVKLGLRFSPQRIWACHSNSAIPCVATGLNSFPEGCERYTEPENFLKAVGRWEE